MGTPLTTITVLLLFLWTCSLVMNTSLARGELQESWESKNAQGLQSYREHHYEQAIQLFSEALLFISQDSKSNPQQAMTLNNLAAAHEALSQYDEAELYYRQSLTMVERIQGSTHPDLLPGLKNLALLHHKRKRYAHAERLYQRSLSILEKALGKDHPHLIPSLLDLAHVSQTQEEFGRAEQYYTRALKIGEAQLAPAHHQVQSIRMQFAALLRHLNRVDEAEELERQAQQKLQPSQ